MRLALQRLGIDPEMVGCELSLPRPGVRSGGIYLIALLPNVDPSFKLITHSGRRARRARRPGQIKQIDETFELRDLLHDDPSRDFTAEEIAERRRNETFHDTQRAGQILGKRIASPSRLLAAAAALVNEAALVVWCAHQKRSNARMTTDLITDAAAVVATDAAADRESERIIDEIIAALS